MEDRLEEGQIWRWRDFRLLKLLKWEMMKVKSKALMEDTGEVRTHLSTTAPGTLVNNFKTQRMKM